MSNSWARASALLIGKILHTPAPSLVELLTFAHAARGSSRQGTSSKRLSALRDAIFPTREEENGLFKGKPSTKAVFPFSRGKNRISQGVENRGPLVSVPLALRDYKRNDYRTELYYFQITFGNSCSVNTEPICFWNYLVSVRSESRGLPNPLPNCFWNYIR